MIYNLNSGEVPIRHEYDLTIVGAGAAGITLAREWAGQDAKVALIETGGFENSQKQRDLLKGEVTGGIVHGDRYLEVTRQKYFGGATNHWSGWCRPLDAIDFEKRSWVPESGWPFGKEILESYYRKAEKMVNIDPFPEVDDDKTLKPPKAEHPWFSMPFFQFSVPPVNFRKAFREELEEADNIDLFLYSNLADVRLSDNNAKVEHIEIKGLQGYKAEINPGVFVLACGGIENPRLMLNFRKDIPDGVGNQNGLVGKYFMEHPHFSESARVLGDLDKNGTSEGEFFLRKFDRDWTEVQNERVVVPSPQLMEREGLLNVSLQIFDHKNLDQLNSNPELNRALKQVTRKWWNKSNEDLKDTKRIFIRAEQPPEEKNRVELSNERDAIGLLRTHLYYDLSEKDRDNYKKTLELLAQYLGMKKRARMRLDLKQETELRGGAHHLGTTRMHSNPSKGVVDPDAKVHGIENFYIAGSSIFPTGGFANPTLTILALTLKLSDHLKEKLSRGK